MVDKEVIFVIFGEWVGVDLEKKCENANKYVEYYHFIIKSFKFAIKTLHFFSYFWGKQIKLFLWNVEKRALYKQSS